MAKIVGLDAIDPLRELDYNVQPFQKPSRYVDEPARIAAFEPFVLRCLDVLQAHTNIFRFGLAVESAVDVEREVREAPKVVVTQEVTLVQFGPHIPVVNALEFYESWFPFSGVWDGVFILDRKDERVQRYLEATEHKDHDTRRCMLTLLAVEAEKAFTSPEFVIRVRHSFKD